MPFQLVRRPVHVDVRDQELARAWLMDRIRHEVKLRGEPHPRIILLLGAGFEETLDLDAVARTDPEAHLGATFQRLRTTPDLERRFVLMQMSGNDRQSGAEQRFALLFEERDVDDGRRWWGAALEYHTDEATGIGLPAASWHVFGETHNPAELLPFLREVAAPPPGARPADVFPADDVWRPDIRFMFGDLPEDVPPPRSAKEMVELGAALAVDELLRGDIQGSVVVRIAGRAWEKWVLSGEMPDSVEEVARYIANARLPPADGVALLQLAIRPHDEPPQLGMQVVGELGGHFVETWGPIVCPDGPQGPKRVTEVRWWPPQPVGPNGMWIGVPSAVRFEESGPEG